jgi:hypothetical protein
MQVTVQDAVNRGTRRFWPMALGIVVLILALWSALNHFDKTLSQARAFLAANTDVKAKIGNVEGTTLYKVRYLDGDRDRGRCFAEYFFFVSGEKGASLNVRVRACGDREAPSFVWIER